MPGWAVVVVTQSAEIRHPGHRAVAGHFGAVEAVAEGEVDSILVHLELAADVTDGFLGLVAGSVEGRDGHRKNRAVGRLAVEHLGMRAFDFDEARKRLLAELLERLGDNLTPFRRGEDFLGRHRVTGREGPLSKC